MPREKALEYIKITRNAGFSDVEIRRELEKSGWPLSEIDAAFHNLDQKPEKVQPPPQFVKKELPRTFVQKPKESIPPKVALPEPHEKLLDAPHTSVPYDEIKPRQIPISKGVSPRQPVVTDSPAPEFRSREHMFSGKQEEAAAPKSPILLRPNMVPVGHKKTYVAAFSIFGLIVASAASAGFWYWSAVLYPQKVVKEGLGSLATMKSFEYDTEFSLRVERDASGTVGRAVQPFLHPMASVLYGIVRAEQKDGPPSYTFTVRAKGAVDYHDQNNPRYQLVLTLGTRSLLGSNVEFESKLSEGVYYFRFLELPFLDSRAFFGDDVPTFTTKSLEEKWVSFNPVAFQEEFNASVEKLAKLDPRFQEYIISPEHEPDLITQDKIKQIQDLWDKNSFISWEEKVFPEDVDGELTYRVKGKLDREKLVSFLEEAAKVSDDAERREIVDAFGMLGDIEINAWISENTRRVVKLTSQTALTDPHNPSAEITELLFEIRFSHIDEPVSVELPHDAYDLKNILDHVFPEQIKKPK